MNQSHVFFHTIFSYEFHITTHTFLKHWCIRSNSKEFRSENSSLQGFIHLWLDIFHVSPCRKLFSSLYLSIFEQYLENNYLKKLLTRIPTFITFSKLLQITDCSIVKKSLKILPLPPGTCIMTSFVQVFLRKSVKFHDGHFDFLLLLTFSRWESSSFLVDFSNFIHEWYLKWIPMICNSCSILQRSLFIGFFLIKSVIFWAKINRQWRHIGI